MIKDYKSKNFSSAIFSGILMLMLFGISAFQANAQTVVGGNPTCADLGFASELKVDPPKAGTYNLPNGGQVTATINSEGGVSFQTMGTTILAAIIKGGPNANVYYFNPAATSGGPLTTPINPNNNKNYGLSHFNFCYETSFAPTAATAMLAGRVTTDDTAGFSRGSNRLIVTLLNVSTLETQTVLTNRLGYYEFNDLPVGDTYIISVRGKGYSFAPQTFTLNEDSAMDMLGVSSSRSGEKGSRVK